MSLFVPLLEFNRDSDAREAFLTYVDEKKAGAIGEMNFKLQDFRDYIEQLRKRSRK